MNLVKATEICKEFGIKKSTLYSWKGTKVSFDVIEGVTFFNREDVEKIINDKIEKKKPKGIRCFICGEVTNYNSYSTFTCHHLKEKHKDISTKEYYDTYIGNEKERYCELCGKEKRFLSIKRGYNEFCSDHECNSSNEKIIEKIENTKLERYGDKHYVNMEKAKKTNLKKYGQEHYTNREKASNTNIERYGTKNTMSVDFIKNKSLKSKAKNKIEFYEKTDDDIEILSLDKQLLKVKCNKCGNESELSTKLVYTRRKYGITLCCHCFPICDMNVVSSKEKEILDFIKENYDGEILPNNRSKISKEIDIYLPELKLGFEYNGFFWHSDKKKDKNYHKEKTDECEGKGIRLIHIFEDEWKYKKDIIKSKILNLLGKTGNKIFARKCYVVENVEIQSQKEFYEENHIQGYVANKNTIGLKYNDKYVAMMSFSSNRNKHIYDEELVRYATDRNSVVIGGASKLFKNYIKDKKNITIVSYADRCWSVGGLYDTIGFEKTGISKPSYFYVDPKYVLREHRFKYRKDMLNKMGFNIDNKTEFQIIDNETNLLRIYDCGKITYIYKT